MTEGKISEHANISMMPIQNKALRKQGLNEQRFL
jgi:hypothetical protein